MSNSEMTATGNNTPRVSEYANGAGSGASNVISTLALEELRDHLQSTGYRVEVVRNGPITFLRSATSGIPFDIRPGSAAVSAPDRFMDATFVALFAVKGTLPLELLNNWNRSHRFGRLFLDRPVAGQEFLVFSLDASIAGGVAPIHLRSQVEIWDGLVQQLIPWLRDELSKVAPAVDPSIASDNVSQGDSSKTGEPLEKSAD